MLKAEGLHKKYPGEQYGAIIDISFNLVEQEVLAIVGKSGSGKSTLLQMLSGLMKPDSGSITFNGKALENPEEQLIAGHEEIKMVFQDFQVKPNMSVLENVKYKLLHFNSEFQQERSQELLELCGLKSLADKKPNELSGGQKQRLSLARALADDPKLLLMDEPFSNLDPIIKEDLLMELTEIVKKEKLSLILVSHDVKDAMLIADRIAYIEDGRLLQMATPREIYRHPQNLDIAKFFGRVNALSIEKNKVIYIRAQDLSTTNSNNAFKAKATNCTFLGMHYLCIAKGLKSNDIYFFNKEKVKLGESIFLGFDTESQIHFSDVQV